MNSARPLAARSLPAILPQPISRISYSLGGRWDEGCPITGRTTLICGLGSLGRVEARSSTIPPPGAIASGRFFVGRMQAIWFPPGDQLGADYRAAGSKQSSRGPSVSGHFRHEFRGPDGRIIVLFDAIWNTEIQRDHAELAGEIEAVRRTIEDPDEVRIDEYFHNRDCYYRRGALRRFPRQWLKVVVEPAHEDPDIGLILTAFMQPRPKESEEVRWKKRSE